MVFELSGEHNVLRHMFREFAEAEVAPIANEIDENDRFPM